MKRISKIILILFIILFFMLSIILTLQMALNKSSPTQNVNVNVNTEPKKMDINKVSEKELKALPTIGDKKAKLISEYIKKNKVNSIDDLRNIEGIGDETIEALKSEVDIKWYLG